MTDQNEIDIDSTHSVHCLPSWFTSEKTHLC
jgi:hypothetical protein